MRRASQTWQRMYCRVLAEHRQGPTTTLRSASKTVDGETKARDDDRTAEKEDESLNEIDALTDGEPTYERTGGAGTDEGERKQFRKRTIRYDLAVPSLSQMSDPESAWDNEKLKQANKTDSVPDTLGPSSAEQATTSRRGIKTASFA